MKFRKDINGLRAIAVIGVLLFHFNEFWMPGGFAGVDVFFVISGFLMTGIIFRGIEQENFSSFKFYVARANRIVPALSVLCLILLIFGWFFTLDSVFETMSEHVGSSVGFFSNLTYWREAGYFETASHEKWLLHTWSLSVEWQFYIIYPLALVVIHKFSSVKVLKALIIVGTLLSFVICIYVTYKMPNPAYYLLPTRMWEMLLGGVAYIYPFTLKDKEKKYLELSGLALILGSYLFISKENPWPGYLAIFPVLGSFLIIQAKCNNSLVTGNVILQKIGSWSYSIYLWHWPLVVYMYIYMEPSFTVIALLITLSIILGFLSYSLVERRILGIKALVLWSITLGLSTFIFFNNGKFDIREKSHDPRNKILNTYKKYQMDPTGLFSKCNASIQIEHKGVPQVDKSCVSLEKGGIFVWGDSHMGALSTGLRYEMAHNTPFSMLTSSGCAPSFAIKRNGFNRFDQGCDFSNSIAYESILKAKPNVVIIGTFEKHENYDWIATFTKLKSMGITKIILIGPFPQWQPSLPIVYVERHMGEDFISDKGFSKSLIKSNDYLISLSSKHKDLVFINMLDNLCFYTEKSELKCRAKIDDTLLAFDAGHLTVEASRFIAKHYIVPYL